MIQKSIAAFVVFYLIAFFIGGWGDIILVSLKARCSLCFRLAFGGCLLMLLGMAICFAGSLFGIYASTGVLIIAFAVSVVGILSVIVRRRMGIRVSYGADTRIGTADMLWLSVIALVIVFQIVAVIRCQNDNISALRGMGTAALVYDTGILSVNEPVFLFIGAVSSVMHVHPLALVHVIMPAPLILLYYLCYFEVIRTVCITWRKTLIALTAVLMLNIWGFLSEKMIPVTLLLTWFGFWVFIVHGILNIAAVIVINYLQAYRAEDNEDDHEDGYSEEWDMKKHKIVNARNLAIGLGILAVLLVATVFVLNNKINRLYAATVNLQDDINSRCSIYEFKPDGGDTEGYLIREGDGTVTFIGGGGPDNTDSLRDFLSKYGNSVENWYTYGDDDDNAGAMHDLIEEQSVFVQNAYIIDRKEITDLK